MFPDFGTPLKKSTNAFIEWLVTAHGDMFEAASNGVLVVLVGLENILRAAPPWAMIGIVGAIMFAASRKPVLSLALMACAWLIGALGLWSQAMQTTAIMLVSVMIAMVLGVPAGLAMARWRWVRAGLNPVLDLMQTIPSFVYLIPAAMLFGLGKVPAILATVIYATPPLVRLTDLGIRHVAAEAVEAGTAFGATRWQLLAKIQIPLAMPSILQGLNQTIMMALAMVVIASMIGARGIGETVLLGLQRNDPGKGLIGGLAIVLLAIIFDRISQAVGRRFDPDRRKSGGT